MTADKAKLTLSGAYERVRERERERERESNPLLMQPNNEQTDKAEHSNSHDT